MWQPLPSPPARWLMPLLLAGAAAVRADPAPPTRPADANGTQVPVASAAPAVTPTASQAVASAPPAPLGWGTGFERRQFLRPPPAPTGPQSPAGGSGSGGFGAGHGRGKGR